MNVKKGEVVEKINKSWNKPIQFDVFQEYRSYFGLFFMHISLSKSFFLVLFSTISTIRRISPSKP